VIDHFAILVSHGLLALVAWRLLSRDDLNDEGARRGWGGRRANGDRAPDA